MKLSLCSIGDREMNIKKVIARTAQLGYEGIELYEPHIRSFLDRGHTIEELADLLHEHNLVVSVISSYAVFCESADRYNQTIAQFSREVLPWAKYLQGAPVRILLDWIGTDKATFEERLQIVNGLRVIAEMAAVKGLMLLMETHQDQLTDSTKATIQLIKDVGMENIRVNLDIYNLFEMGENPLRALEELLPSTSNIHLKNGKLVEGKISYGILLAEGNMNFKPFLKEVCRLFGYRMVWRAFLGSC